MKNKSLLLITLILGLLFFGFWYLSRLSRTQTPNISTPIPSSNSITKFQIEQKIDFGGLSPQEIKEVEVIEGESVFDVISKNAQIEFKEYSFGKLIESINGVKNETDNKYWIFYINSEESKVGATEYLLKPNDKIEWRFKAYEQ